MNAEERQMFVEMKTMVTTLCEENRKYREQLTARINAVEKTVAPANMETDILNTIQKSIGTTISTALGAYDSPLIKLTKAVVEKHNQELTKIVDSAFSSVINTESFATDIRQSFSHSIARAIISNANGLVDKVANDLKQNPQFRAKATLAISSLVEEFKP
jgi:hypothetical protein